MWMPGTHTHMHISEYTHICKRIHITYLAEKQKQQKKKKQKLTIPVEMVWEENQDENREQRKMYEKQI